MANISISDINVAGASLLTELTEAELQVTGGGGYSRGGHGRGGSRSGKGSRSRSGKGKGSRSRSGKGRGCYGCFPCH